MNINSYQSRTRCVFSATEMLSYTYIFNMNYRLPTKGSSVEKVSYRLQA